MRRLKTRKVWIWNGEKSLRTRLIVLAEFTNVTDGRTPHDGMGKAYMHSIMQQKKNEPIWCKLAQVVHMAGVWNDQLWDQKVKGQGHMRPKLDLEAWWRHRSRPIGRVGLQVSIIYKLAGLKRADVMQTCGCRSALVRSIALCFLMSNVMLMTPATVRRWARHASTSA